MHLFGQEDKSTKMYGMPMAQNEELGTGLSRLQLSQLYYGNFAGTWKRIGAMVRPRPLFTDISILFVVYKMASYGVSAMIGLRTAHGDILLHQILIRQLIRLKINDMDYFEPVEVARKIFYDQISCGYRHHLRIVIYAAAYIPAMDTTGATADRTGQGQPGGSGPAPRRARIP